MKLRSEAKLAVKQVDLQTERAVLEECIRSYDLLLGLLEEHPEQPIALPVGSGRFATIAQIERLTASLRKAARTSADPAERTSNASQDSPGSLRRLIQCCAVLLSISVVAVGWWWMYQRPVRLAFARLAGSWQQCDLTDAGETERQYYRTFEGDKLTSSFHIPHDDEWQKYQRRFELIPATGFFQMKTTNVPGDRPVAGAEFYIQIVGDKIHEIRGIHRLDPMRKAEINLWRRTRCVPTEGLSHEARK